MVTAQIELQACPTCPVSRRRFIGPDLREKGLFNYNNSVVVAHELLDEYTISYVTSETPFTAFVTLVAHRYAVSGATFMKEDLFRAVWFSYASLQALDNDMRCSRCGPYPETVIWDGITLAFGRKHLSASLTPPTTTTTASIVRHSIKYQPKQQLLVDVGLRKKLRQVLQGPELDDVFLEEDNSDDDSTRQYNKEKLEQKSRRIVEHLDRVQEVWDGLKEICPELGELFVSFYGASAYSKRLRVPPEYRSFFLQVAAEESVLQMVNGAALSDLRQFLSNPQGMEKTQLLSIPGLYRILTDNHSLNQLIPVMDWLAQRATKVLQALEVERLSIDSGNIQFPQTMGLDDWKSTGCFYSLPQIRFRPIYPNLKSDTQVEKSSRRGDRCGKFYSDICYGFHCIPASEGRNDVFSAIVTRWPVAPKRIIYDFACALGPYCMLREPLFFKNTLFCIDHFHAAGHTKCSPAAFLSEYANVDPRLVAINSSAGECGNSSLKRIRKSVSYMSQERAIIYTKVFLSVWNRIRLQKMQ
ncbi:hypothetical protein H1R20_g16268, partial [Candolleomyces eurysporus]